MNSARLQQLLSLHEDSPDDAFILFALAKEYEGLGQTEQALNHYKTLEEKDAMYVGLYYHLGKLQEQLNQPQLAWETYSKGLRIAKQLGDQHAWNELAGARLHLGDEEDFE